MTKKRTDWKSIAEDMADQLSMAISKLKNTSDWTGTLRNNTTGECYPWEESFARSIERMPGYKVDRRYMEAKWLPAKQRQKAFRDLYLEKQEKSSKG